MRKFISKIIIVALPILILIMSANYFIDPVGLFSDKNIEARAADIISKGNNVAGLVNYDERLLQKLLIENLQQCPSTIVLGSSRGMLINQKNTKDSNLVNNCVSGAKLEDILAVYQIYQEKGYTPRRVIIEVSPYMFNDKYRDVRYKTIEQQYNTLATKLELNTTNNNSNSNSKWQEIFSLSYFKNAIKSINKPVDSIYATKDSLLLSHSLKFPDGSIIYSKEYQDRKVSPQDILDAIVYGESKYFTSLSPDRQRIFETFVNYLQNNNVKVSLLLAPIPEEVAAKQKMFDQTQKYLETFCAKTKIKIIGNYDQSNNPLKLDDFYDGMHPKQSVYDSIMTQF